MRTPSCQALQIQSAWRRASSVFGSQPCRSCLQHLPFLLDELWRIGAGPFTPQQPAWTSFKSGLSEAALPACGPGMDWLPVHAGIWLAASPGWPAHPGNRCVRRNPVRPGQHHTARPGNPPHFCQACKRVYSQSSRKWQRVMSKISSSREGKAIVCAGMHVRADSGVAKLQISGMNIEPDTMLCACCCQGSAGWHRYRIQLPGFSLSWLELSFLQQDCRRRAVQRACCR